MSATFASRLLSVRNPMLNVVRTRTRTPNLRKPAIPHWTRAVVLKLVEPIYKDPEEEMQLRDRCQRKLKSLKENEKQINPFEQILANEFREKIEKAKIIAVFHMFPMKQSDLYAARLQLNKIKMKYLRHNITIMNLAFSNTKYEALLKLNQSTSCVFVGDDPGVVGKLLKFEKKISGLVLLGGVVEERFMSVQDLKNYASLPSLDTLRAQLVSILNTPVQQLSQNLYANQTELSSGLSRYAEEPKPDEESPQTSSSTE